ncbi:MAG: hypothetical protein ACRDD7_07255 [Peptostreptococcaceae bacterium]
MRTFKPSKKGIIRAGEKDYYLKLDSMTITLVMMDSLPKMEEIRNEAEKQRIDFEKGLIEQEAFIDTIEKSFIKLSQHNERFCKRMIGETNFNELYLSCGGLNFDDLQGLTNLIIGELIDIKNETKESLLGGVGRG